MLAQPGQPKAAPDLKENVLRSQGLGSAERPAAKTRMRCMVTRNVAWWRRCCAPRSGWRHCCVRGSDRLFGCVCLMLAAINCAGSRYDRRVQTGLLLALHLHWAQDALLLPACIRSQGAWWNVLGERVQLWHKCSSLSWLHRMRKHGIFFHAGFGAFMRQSPPMGASLTPSVIEAPFAADDLRSTCDSWSSRVVLPLSLRIGELLPRHLRQAGAAALATHVRGNLDSNS